MEEALLEIIEAVRSGVVGGEGAGSSADAAWLDKLVRRHNRAAHDGTRQVAKRRLLPFYLHVKAEDPERWAGVEGERGDRRGPSCAFCRPRPRRTASGVPPHRAHEALADARAPACSARTTSVCRRAIFPTSRPASGPSAAGSTPSCRWPPVCARSRPWGTSPTKWSLSCWAAPGATTPKATSAGSQASFSAP